MRRFKVGDRIKFKQGSTSTEQEGVIIDTFTVDFNDVYVVDCGSYTPLYLMDIAPNTITRA